MNMKDWQLLTAKTVTRQTNGSVDNTNINNYDVLQRINKRIIMEEFDKWLEELIDKYGTVGY